MNLKPLIKKAASANAVPQTGGQAFSEGWDITACPFNYDPRRQQWLDEWQAANDAAYEAIVRGIK